MINKYVVTLKCVIVFYIYKRIELFTSCKFFLTEFEKWKHTFETREVCRFVKKSGSRVDNSGKSMYLYCSRSGNFVSHGKGTRFKKIGTAKISAHCTALIKYFEQSSGKVKATVCTTHYGHDKDHRFLRLTKDQKLHIAEKMKSGMSSELVLDSLRSTFVNKMDRIHELSKRDLNNIQKTFKIPKISERRKSQSNTTGVFNPFDLIQEDWITEIDTTIDSPVIFYKNLSCENEKKALTNKDKCLILMTKGQKDLFVKFCNNGVLYVTILKLSGTVSLHLTVIFILDDFYETFPVCFMISTDTRKEILTVLFDEILTAVGPIALRALATDSNEIVQRAWCDVMGPISNLIIANRHVDAEWRRNLTVVENEAYQGEIYDKLYEFIEGNEGTSCKMENLISELRSTVVATSFAQYLENNWLKNIKQWSTCYLKEAYDLCEPIDFETSYNKISNLCDVCCRYNKSVSYGARGLIKLLLDFQSTRNRKVAENVIEINSAHDLSLAYGSENVFPVANGVWKVNANKNGKEMFQVRVAQCNFDDCVLTCARCNACIHNFYCTCENYIDGKTCVHVHLVGHMLTKIKNDVVSNEDAETLRKFDLMVDSLLNEVNVDILPEQDSEAMMPSSEPNSELRLKKLETLKILEEIGKMLLAENDEKNLASLHLLITDVRGNVDMLLKYGGHAKNVAFAKNSKLTKVTKPVKKKHRVIRQTRSTTALKTKKN